MKAISSLWEWFRVRAKSQSAQTFKAPKYDRLTTVRYWAQISKEVFGWTLSVYMVTVAVVADLTIILWHLFLAEVAADSFALSDVSVYGLTIIVWTTAALAVFLAVASNILNRRKMLIWLGFLSDVSRKKDVASMNANKMLAVTRHVSYLAVAAEATLLLWWWSVFPQMPEGWQHLEPWRWDPIELFLKQSWIWFLGYGFLVNFERWWAVRRTRVALVAAFFGAIPLLLFFNWWYVNNIDNWIDFRMWFGN